MADDHTGLPTAKKAKPNEVENPDLSISVAIQLNEIAGNVGRLQEAVDTLKTLTEKHTDNIDGIKTRISIAIGAVLAFGLIGAGILWLISTIIDRGLTQIIKLLIPA